MMMMMMMMMTNIVCGLTAWNLRWEYWCQVCETVFTFSSDDMQCSDVRVMYWICWIAGQHSGRRNGDRHTVVVQSSVGRDFGEAGNRVVDGARNWHNTQPLQASGNALVDAVLLHLWPRQHRAHVSVLAHLVHQPLPTGNRPTYR